MEAKKDLIKELEKGLNLIKLDIEYYKKIQQIKRSVITFKALRSITSKNAYEISSDLGIVEGTYRKYESSVRLPSINVINKMASAYNCSYDEVMEAYNYHKHIYDTKRLYRKSKMN